MIIDALIAVAVVLAPIALVVAGLAWLADWLERRTR